MSRYRELVAKGLCGLCGKRRHDPGVTVCGACREQRKKWGRARYIRLVNEGKCVVCGNEAQEGKTMCRACAVRQAEKCYERYQGFREKGLCPWCGKVYPTDGKVICRECWKKYRGKPVTTRGETV